MAAATAAECGPEHSTIDVAAVVSEAVKDLVRRWRRGCLPRAVLLVLDARHNVRYRRTDENECRQAVAMGGRPEAEDVAVNKKTLKECVMERDATCIRESTNDRLGQRI